MEDSADGPIGAAEPVERCSQRVGDDESMTSLAEIVHQLEGLDSDAVIFAEQPWQGDTRAMVVAVDDAESMAEQQDLIYLLEVDLAREVLEVWSAWRNDRQPSPAEAVAAIVYYAQRDAFMPVEHQPN